MADHSGLLVRFQPQLRYDSNEAFFADSAAEWTDNPGNVLHRSEGGQPGGVIAARAPGVGPAALSLEFLGELAYQNEESVAEDDAISAPTRNYRAMYVALRQLPGYKNRMYGRAKEDSKNRLWLQYWFYYFFNDYNLAGGIGLHEGDWEMVQYRMGVDGERPDLAVYAQHIHAEQAPWEHVEKHPENPDTPIVYIARGSHASYFETGYHETEAWYDIADGKRETPKLELEIIGDEPPGWILWPGRWGATRVRIPKIDQPSPRGPATKAQWADPEALTHRARTHERPEALAAPNVRVGRESGRLVVSFDFTTRPEPKPERLVMTVNSRDDPLPPRTFTFAVEPALRGRIETRIDLHEHQRYDIYFSITDNQGRPSESTLELIGATGERKRPIYERIGPPIGRAFGKLRDRIGGLLRRGGQTGDG
jgi:hypothetical protein